MMAEYINRQLAIGVRFADGFNNDGVLYVPYRDLIKHLESLPSEPVRKTGCGKWLIKNGKLYCSNCGAKALLRVDKKTDDYDYCESNFCPNCGADMGDKTWLVF